MEQIHKIRMWPNFLFFRNFFAQGGLLNSYSRSAGAENSRVVYIYIYTTPLLLPRVMDPTVQPSQVCPRPTLHRRLTLRVPPARPTPHHPPVQPRAACPHAPASSIPTNRPCAARPTPRRLPDLASLHPPSHISPTDERIFLLASRRPATGERPCLLRPAPLPWAPLPPLTLCLTKCLSKSQNDWLLYQNPKNGWVKF
jgi:hypothetical protein